jgi:hypothetical protein
MSVSIQPGPAFTFGNATRLLDATAFANLGGLGLVGRNYDVSPDGQRFLMIKVAEQPQIAPRINVVLNWNEELKRLVPTR